MLAGHVSYATLVAARAALSGGDAVALALAAACRADAAPDARALPAPERILLSSTGDVWFDGTDDEATERTRVAQLSELLRRLLGVADETGDERHVRVPGALLVLMARAAGEIDLPPPSYAVFRQALQRFAPEDLPATLASIYWRSAQHQAGSTEACAAVPQGATVMPFPETGRAAPLPRVERRTRGPRIEDLRRELREADIRLYLQLQRNRRTGLRRLLRPGAGVAAALLLVALAVPAVLDWSRRAESYASHAPGAFDAAAPLVWEPPAGHLGPVQTPDDPVAAPAAAGAAPPGLTGQTDTRGAAGQRDPAAGRARTPLPISAGLLLSPAVVGADVFSPSFGADGRELLFHAGRDGAPLMRAALDGGEPAIVTLLNDGAANYHATLSPDGHWLAYDSDREGTRAVYVSRVDGSERRRISGNHYAAVPRWSHDGRRLAFVQAEPARARVWNVWVADLDARTLTRVSRHRVGQAWGASWFPDGEHIAYSVEDTLVIAGLQSGGTRVVRSPRPGRLIRTPAVSPDGKWVVFQVHRDGAWLLDVSTGAMQRLLDDPAAEEFAWSPDGRRIVYHTQQRGRWSVWQVEWEVSSSG